VRSRMRIGRLLREQQQEGQQGQQESLQFHGDGV
jgi:hypothetical protein